jgi:DNA polymerase V
MKTFKVPHSLPSPPGVISVRLNPTTILLPVYGGKVSAGQSRWVSAAQDYDDNDEGSLDGRLDLNTRFIKNPPSTFLMPVTGDSMTEAGIYPGSLLIIDKSIKPRSSHIVVVWYESQYLVKRLYIRGKVIKLLSEHPDQNKYLPIEFKKDEELMVWGVVKHAINTY